MEEKSWNEMNGWEKTWEVTKIAAGLAFLVLALAAGGGSHRSNTSQGGSVWTVGSGGKKPGSWSSGRHR